MTQSDLSGEAGLAQDHEVLFDLQPLQQIEVGETSWTATGNDPAFSAGWGGGALAKGWYELELRIDLVEGTILRPCLYPDYGHGVHASDVVPLKLESLAAGQQVQRCVVLFTKDVFALRFDPTVTFAKWAALSVRLRRIGKQLAARRMVAGVLSVQPHAGAKLMALARMGLHLLRGARFMAERLYRRYVQWPRSEEADSYGAWRSFYDSAGEMWHEEAASKLAALHEQALVSVLMPVCNTPERWLRLAIESVRAQVYPNWELCIADDASSLSSVRRVLDEYVRTDARIKVTYRERNGHISAASNSALALAEGRYIALLDHDDELHPMALLEAVRAFQQHPEWRMLFTDEDKIDEEGRRSEPYFKSDWNPELFLSQNCVCHLTVYEKSLVDDVGGFRTGVEGAQDWDLTLRVSERLGHGQIGHVHRVLYHWRMIEGSTALAPGEKGYAHVAALRALREHLARVGNGAKVLEMEGYSGYYRIEHPLPTPAPLVSLLIPTRNRVDLLKQCVDSILEKTTYPNFEIIVLDNQSDDPATLAYMAQVADDPRVRVLAYDHPFNYSEINNFGAQHAHGSVLGFVNNDIEVITPGWLEELVSHALRPEIGVVGAMLYYPNDTLQHAGVVLGIGGVAGHVYVGLPRGYPGDKHRAGLAQAMSVVTAACAVMRKSVFDEIGGFDVGLKVAFNDVDLCLRVGKGGYRNVWTPFAELYHHESASRGYEDTPEKIERFKQEESFMKRRWGGVLSEDPYYNRNFSLSWPPYTLAYPPRINR